MHPPVTPSRTRRLTATLAAVLLAVAGIAVAPGAPSTVSADPPAFVMFDNGKLRFGGNSDNSCYSGCATATTPEHSLSANGLPKQPFYWSSGGSSWYKLTYSTYPLNLAIGTGTSGSNWSGATVADVASLTGLTIDESGFVSTGAAGSGVKGHGVLSATGTANVAGTDFEITNITELGANDSYVKITTRIKNISGTPTTNTTMWVGTQDDYVGSDDGPTKTKGNIVDGAFEPTGSASTPAKALLIESGPEGVLFYSTTPGTNASIDDCCGFSNAYEVAPTASPTTRTGDGSYAMNVPVADLAPGATTEIVWFYAAGAVADLDAVIAAVAAAASPPAPTVTPGNGHADVAWTAPASTDPITDYSIRYRETGSAGAWTTVRKGDANAPLTKQLTGLTNGTSYDVQVAGVTGTGVGEVVGGYSATAVVVPGNPVNDVLPTISGTVRVGSTLTMSDAIGNWRSIDGTAMTSSRQWQADGVDIPGATGTTLLVTSDLAGAQIRVLARRTNTSGTTTAASAATAAVPDVYLSGLTTSAGAVSPTFSPTTFAYTRSVSSSDSSITITPTAPVGATVEVDGVDLAGDPSRDVSLSVGDNSIPVVVTRGGTSLTYTVVVNRPSAVTTTTAPPTTTTPPTTTPPTTSPTISAPAYHPATPTRLLDTREIGAMSEGGRVLEIQVAGRDGIPSDATSAILNVVTTGGASAGFVTVYPCGTERPWASSLNFQARQTTSNAVVSKIGTDGKVCIYVTAQAHVVVDVNGYYAEGAGDGFDPLTPRRFVDTRDAGEAVPAGGVLEVQVAGVNGVPADATVAALNLTIVDALRDGFATVYPCGSTRPATSSINFTASAAISNAVLAEIGTDGKVCVYLQRQAHVVVDVNGSYGPTGSARQTSFAPARLVDTRDHRADAPVAGSVLEVQVAGRHGVPADATAAVLNVTVVDPAGEGYATVYPCGVERPWASTINYASGVTTPNAVIAKLGAGGTVCIFVQRSAHVVVDVSGALVTSGPS